MPCFRSENASYHCKIILLDDQELLQEVQGSTLGQQLLDNVFRHLNLLETAYFGLRYVNAAHQSYWLDPQKKVVKQLKGCSALTLYFCVKFYAADPCRLVEEITRYQFFLHIKQDILEGRLPVHPELAAELAALIIQSELGDYDPSRHVDGYVRELSLFPTLTPALEHSICELHKTLVGRVPSVVEFNFLEKVRWLEMYGVDLHPVLGEDHIEYFIGLTPAGVIVLRGKAKISNYFWPRISKVNFKGKYFMLRVRDKNNEESTYGFETPSRDACKHLWKCCVEQHSFFRLIQITQSTNGAKTLSISSRFRYSGRTEKEAQREASLHRRPPPTFSRSSSRRSNASSQHAQRARGGEPADQQSTCQMSLSIPQPVQSVSSMYRSGSMTLRTPPRPDSPRSVRSAPFSANQSGSARSATNELTALFSSGGGGSLGRRGRSASADSTASLDSRAQRRHRRRRGSGQESDASSAGEGSRPHRKQRSRRGAQSGSESERSASARSNRARRHRHARQSGEMVDSELQCREVPAVDNLSPSGDGGAPTAATLPATPRRSGYLNSGMETESELSYPSKRRHRKHRSRSRSPEAERCRRLPAQLRRHLQFQLVEPPADADAAAHIAYTRVQTDDRLPRIRYAARRQHREGNSDGSGASVSRPEGSGMAGDALWPAAPRAGAACVTSTPVAAGPVPSPTSSPAAAAAAAHYSVPPSSGWPRPAAAAKNTLSSYYVTSVTADRDTPVSTVPAGARASAHTSITPVATHRTATTRAVLAAYPVEPHHDHSDSGLGNESPSEFTRMRSGSPILSATARLRVSNSPTDSRPAATSAACNRLPSNVSAVYDRLPAAKSATADYDRLRPVSAAAYDRLPPAAVHCRPSPAWSASLPRGPSLDVTSPRSRRHVSATRSQAVAASTSLDDPKSDDRDRANSTLPRPSSRSSADIITAYTTDASRRPGGGHLIQPPLGFQNQPEDGAGRLSSSEATSARGSSPASSAPLIRPAESSSAAADPRHAPSVPVAGGDREGRSGRGDSGDAATPRGARRGPPVPAAVAAWGSSLPSAAAPVELTTTTLARAHRSDSAGSLELILTPMLNSATQFHRR